MLIVNIFMEQSHVHLTHPSKLQRLESALIVYCICLFTIVHRLEGPADATTTTEYLAVRVSGAEWHH